MILKDILTRDIYPLEGKKKGGGVEGSKRSEISAR